MECSWLQVFGLLIFVLKTSRLTEMINASRLGARQSGKTSSKQNRNQLTDIKKYLKHEHTKLREDSVMLTARNSDMSPNCKLTLLPTLVD